MFVGTVRKWLRAIRDTFVLEPPASRRDAAAFPPWPPPLSSATQEASTPGPLPPIAKQPARSPSAPADPEVYHRWRDLVGQLFSGRVQEGLNIPGALELAKLRIRSLPARLDVDGDLDLRQCQRLRHIGDGLTVGGNLSIGGRCPQTLWWEPCVREEYGDPSAKVEPWGRLSRDSQCPLARLPENLLVRGSLRLRSCHRLEQLPETFRFGKSLVIESCQSLHSLPERLEIAGDLFLKGCRSLVEMPSTIQVLGNARLIGLPIQQLPERIKVGGSLVLEDCPRLAELPQGLYVPGDLTVRRCPIRKLPADLRVDGDLIIERCSEEIEIPDSVSVAGDVRFHRCSGLLSIPANIPVRKGLVLTRCEHLRTLPEGLQVPHTLNLQGCTALEAFPRNVKVGYEASRAPRTPALILCDCTALKSLPDDLDIRGPIDVAGSGITDLPKALSSRCQILWRGFAVRPAVVFHPETLGPQEILRERNVELRRVMLERVGVGNVLRAAKAKILDEDRDPGGPRKLVEIVLNFQQRRYLYCRCPSTKREYLLRVPPTIQRCNQAAAWLAGFDDPREYRPVLET